MRVPEMARFTHLLQGFGLLLSGAIIGSAVFTGIYHHNFNELFIINNTLKAENIKLKEDLGSFTKMKLSQSVINNITVHIEEAAGNESLDDIEKEAIRSRVAKDFNLFKGKRADSINAELLVAQQIINNKIFPLHREINDNRVNPLVEEKAFSVKILMLVVNPSKIEIWIQAKEYKQN